MVTIAQAALGGGAIMAAGVLEELTHAAAARPFAVSQRVDIRSVAVEHELPADAPRREAVEKWINMAPMLVGLAALALLYLGVGLPPLSRSTVLLYAAWGWYTVPSLTDLQEAYGDGVAGEGWADERYRGAWMGLSIESVGLLLAFGWDEIHLAAFGADPTLIGVGGATMAYAGMAYLQRAAVLIAIAGGVWVFVRIALAERDNDSGDDYL